MNRNININETKEKRNQWKKMKWKEKYQRIISWNVSKSNEKTNEKCQ